MAVRLALPLWPTLNLERRFDDVVCGVDEAGCAPLAGPVVAAAVVLPRGPKPRALRGLTDSKLLGPEEREHFFEIIQRIGRVGTGLASVAEIDRLNIFHADMLAMRRAVLDLGIAPDRALVDGRGSPDLPCVVQPVVKGDRRSLSIAAASVVAKVVRDRRMQRLARHHPYYGWRTNVGYGTDAHYLGLLRKGPTEHHRRSFAPLNTLFAPGRTVLVGLGFGPVAGATQLSRPRLLRLRQDLHAVFDAAGRHVGIAKNLRGRWTFQAMGYEADGEPVHGGGPCAACHGERISGPDRAVLARLFAGRVI